MGGIHVQGPELDPASPSAVQLQSNNQIPFVLGVCSLPIAHPNTVVSFCGFQSFSQDFKIFILACKKDPGTTASAPSSANRSLYLSVCVY